MKKKFFAILLAFLFILPCFTFTAYAEETETTFMNITLQPGPDGTGVNVNWSTIGLYENSFVQFAKKEDVKNGKFPTKSGESIMNIAEYTLTEAGSVNPIYSYKAEIRGLESLTDYVYRVGDGAEYSALYNYSTPATKNFSALVFNDVQVNISGNSIKEDTRLFSESIRLAKERAPEASLMLHLGDQATNAYWEQYEGLMAADGLKEFAFAPLIGNHDVGNYYFSNFYNRPNSTNNAVTYNAGDYYFKYGKALFVVLNCMTNKHSEHEATFQAAKTAYPDYSWLIGMMHYDVYSTSQGDSFSADNLAYYIDLFEEHKTDVVLTGHVHRFSRSKFIQDDVAVETMVDEQGRYVDPNGIVYYSGPTGIINYASDASEADSEYLDKYIEKHVRYENSNKNDLNYEAGFSTLTVKGNYLSLETYFIARKNRISNGELVETGQTYLYDSFTIVKSSIDENDGNDEVKKADTSNEKSGCKSNISAVSLFGGLISVAMVVVILNRKVAKN